MSDLPDFELLPPPEPGLFSRGWVCQFGQATIRHRVRFNYTGQTGSASRLPKGHPPWLVSGIPTLQGKDQRWFYSLEAALVWAQGEMAMKTTRLLL